jgi:hypothetical protein
VPPRNGGGYQYPELAQRLDRLTLTWTTYEELLEQQFGPQLDIVDLPSEIKGLKEHLEALAAAMQVAAEAP